MSIIGNIHSDIGTKKQVNQDAACLKVKETFLGDTILSVVCDGMGGFSDGELASSSVVLTFSEWFDKKLPELLKNGIGYEVLYNEWMDLLIDQNKKLCDYGEKHDKKIGTTITAMLVLGKKFYLVNVGDSRAYVLTDRIVQLTEDQTLVNKAVLEGKISRVAAENHPKSHILSECVGVTRTINPDFYEGIYNNEATYLICSDGFRHKVTSDELFETFKPEKIVDLNTAKIQEYKMTELCKNRGETDNITVNVFKTQQHSHIDQKKTKALFPENDHLNIYVVHSHSRL